mmetsp:Transcript_1757/g.3229  ORF Transcript_1757/g.3229 Transcript_1757/m.3229 type:complete len:505 (-) Transcript_1757:50-1564(-)
MGKESTVFKVRLSWIVWFGLGLVELAMSHVTILNLDVVESDAIERKLASRVSIECLGGMEVHDPNWDVVPDSRALFSVALGFETNPGFSQPWLGGTWVQSNLTAGTLTATYRTRIAKSVTYGPNGDPTKINGASIIARKQIVFVSTRCFKGDNYTLISFIFNVGSEDFESVFSSFYKCNESQFVFLVPYDAGACDIYCEDDYDCMGICGTPSGVCQASPSTTMDNRTAPPRATPNPTMASHSIIPAPTSSNIMSPPPTQNPPSSVAPSAPTSATRGPTESPTLSPSPAQETCTGPSNCSSGYCQVYCCREDLPNCVACGANGGCTQCADRYFLNADNSSCIPDQDRSASVCVEADWLVSHGIPKLHGEDRLATTYCIEGFSPCGTATHIVAIRGVFNSYAKHCQSLTCTMKITMVNGFRANRMIQVGDFIVTGHVVYLGLTRLWSAIARFQFQLGLYQTPPRRPGSNFPAHTSQAPGLVSRICTSSLGVPFHGMNEKDLLAKVL